MRSIWSLWPLLLIIQSPVLAQGVSDLTNSHADLPPSVEDPASPTAFVVAEVDVHDPVAYEEYKSEAARLIAKYGGRYIVRGGATEIVEGQPPQGRLIVLEFPSMAAAKSFLESDEYRPVAAVRHRSATSRLILAEGMVP